MKRVIPNREVPFYITMQMDFKSNSMTAYNGNCGYKVYSYSTLIAHYYEGVWYINDTYYSVTTSRHQGLVRQGLSLNTIINNSIHLYHVNRYSTDLDILVKGTVAKERIERIKSNV